MGRAAAHSEFFDRIVAQIESGHAGEAIANLTGMLDYASGAPDQFDSVCSAYRDHPIGTLLREGSKQHDSATALSRAIRDSGFDRALHERTDHIRKLLGSAWQGGKSIAVLGGAVRSELAELASRDLGNVTIVEADEASARALRAALPTSAQVIHQPVNLFLDMVARAQGHFDLIYFPRLTEQAGGPALVDTLRRAGQCLTDGGRIVVLAFASGHVGRGWRHLCLDWPVIEHDEASLTAVAEASGLKPTIYCDAAGCFLWGVFTQVPDDYEHGGQNHDQ